MIFAFKNTNPGVVNCDFADILSDYAPFVNLFVVNSSFYFADADIEDAQEWRDQIALNNIIPIYNSDDSEIDHEDPVRNTNIQDVEIEIYRGKYKFSLFFNYDNDLYNKIKELHNKPAYIYLQDKNNNMLSILDGTDNFGIRCDLFAVTKLILGDLSYPSGMRIDLTVDSEQDFNFTKLEFNQNALIYYPLQYFEEVGEPPPSVSYWEIQDCYIIQYGASTVLGFLVTDSNNDEVTTGIILADVSIIDDTHGSQTIYSVSYDTDHWELECDKLPTSGYLYIDSPYGVINFNYDISSLYLSNGIAYPAFSDVVVNTYDQKIPNNCEAFSAVTFDYDYIFTTDWEPGDPQTELIIKINIYAGGDTESSSIITLNDNFFKQWPPPRTGFQYYVLIKYKSNYATVGANDVLRVWAIEDDDSINAFINLDLEDTAGEWKYTADVITLTYPSDDTYRMRIGMASFPRQGTDVVIYIESIYLYEYVLTP